MGTAREDVTHRKIFARLNREEGHENGWQELEFYTIGAHQIREAHHLTLRRGEGAKHFFIMRGAGGKCDRAGHDYTDATGEDPQNSQPATDEQQPEGHPPIFVHDTPAELHGRPEFEPFVRYERCGEQPTRAQVDGSQHGYYQNDNQWNK